MRDCAFENNPTLATVRLSRTWGTRFYFVSDMMGTVRAMGSRRLTLWKGSIQPGYSGGRALTSSSCLSSSAVSLRSTAARLSLSWSRRLAPMMMEVTKGLASSQAREMRAGLQLWALAMGAMTSRMLPGALLVDDGEVEVGAAGVFGLLVFAGELAGEQAAGERAPDEEAGLFGFEEGDDVALEVAAGDGVVGLEGVEAGEVFELGDGEGLGDLPAEPVGDADVADFALLDEGVEGAEGLFDGGDGVVAVDLVEVDVVGLEAAEAGFDGVHDVSAGGADVVAAGAGAAEDLGGDDDFIAGDVEILEGLAESFSLSPSE